MTTLQGDGSTVGLSKGQSARAGRGSASAAALPALTVLYHPDLRRVGDRAVLAETGLGREAPVSRNAPEFLSPDRLVGEPLADPHLSRQPLRFRADAEGGVTIDPRGSRTSVAADGLPIAGPATFSAGQVSQGVVLELAGQVVLLLHRMSPPGVAPLPRHGLVGESPGLALVREDIGRVADLEVPVLLRGETGTGKELVARAIHQAGPRRGGPFVGVNLAAIPPSLSASELFGAVKGAFTGSVAPQEGFFRRAHGGTLFLDEIGEAPPEVQVLLLRALETGEVYPVGSASPSRMDVRVIAATDADLEGKVQAGDFRAPLLHRLAGFDLRLPPLRDRRDDIGRLLLHFLRLELQHIGESGPFDPDSPAHDPRWLPPSVVARLARYDWPGNVRQLRNVIRQLVIVSRGGRALDDSRLEGLLSDRHLASAGSSDAHPVPDAPPPASRGGRRKPSNVGEEEILAALRACRWALKATSERLRISRASLYLLIEGSPRIRKASDLSTEEIEICYQECRGDLDAMVERLEVSKRALQRRVRELRLRPGRGED